MIMKMEKYIVDISITADYRKKIIIHPKNKTNGILFI